MADIGWGHLAGSESVGKPFYSFKDFKEISFEEAVSDKYKELRHAAHGMLYTKLEGKMWDLYPKNATALMQVRFDGMLGFPGGLVDTGETYIHSALNRECQEEIALDIKKFSFTAGHHIVSHVNTDTKLVTHFYAQEVTEAQFCDIERGALQAHEWGLEAFGLIRIPLFVLGDGYRGFPVFLTHRFAGNAREQLILTLQQQKVIKQSQMDILLKAAESYSMKIESECD